MTMPVTLADLERYDKLAWVYCSDCGWERDVPPDALGLPLNTPVPGGRQAVEVLGLWWTEGNREA